MELTNTQKNGDTRLDNLYSIMQSIENKLGGGEGVQGIYGSITRKGMQRIYDCMKHNCGFDHSSTLVDIGAGLGRPLLHALISPGTRGAFGIELDDVKVAKAHAFVQQAVQELARRGCAEQDMHRPSISCQAIEQVNSFGPATHAYSFWEGIPAAGREAFGRLFTASRNMKAVAVVQRAIRGQHPAQLMQSYGFGPLLLIANFPVSMSGSGSSFQAYVFSKINPSAAALLQSAMKPPAAAAACLAAPSPLPAACTKEAAAPLSPPPSVLLSTAYKQSHITEYSKQHKPTSIRVLQLDDCGGGKPAASKQAGGLRTTKAVQGKQKQNAKGMSQGVAKMTAGATRSSNRLAAAKLQAAFIVLDA